MIYRYSTSMYDFHGGQCDMILTNHSTPLQERDQRSIIARRNDRESSDYCLSGRFRGVQHDRDFQLDFLCVSGEIASYKYSQDDRMWKPSSAVCSSSSFLLTSLLLSQLQEKMFYDINGVSCRCTMIRFVATHAMHIPERGPVIKLPSNFRNKSCSDASSDFLVLLS
jgi:hypothetical protein